MKTIGVADLEGAKNPTMYNLYCPHCGEGIKAKALGADNDGYFIFCNNCIEDINGHLKIQGLRKIRLDELVPSTNIMDDFIEMFPVDYESDWENVPLFSGPEQEQL